MLFLYFWGSPVAPFTQSEKRAVACAVPASSVNAVEVTRAAGDCCIASAFVSYLGPFNKEFRDLLIKRDFFSDCKDNDVPVTANMNLTSFLVDDSTVGEWNLQVRCETLQLTSNLYCNWIVHVAR